MAEIKVSIVGATQGGVVDGQNGVDLLSFSLCFAACSQALVLTSIWGAHKKGCDTGIFRAVFPSIWVSWDPKTLQNKQGKMQYDQQDASIT